MSEDNTSSLIDNVRKMFLAIERGDFMEMKSCFTPDAVIWHNFDQVEQSLDEAAAVVAHTVEKCEVKYENMCIDEAPGVCFARYVSAVHLKAGGNVNVPAAMRIEGAEDGRIKRIDEYVDSRATEALM